jgi:hypothetical protein
LRSTPEASLDYRLHFVWVGTTYHPSEPAAQTRRRYVARAFGDDGRWGVYDRYEERYVDYQDLLGMSYEQLGSEFGRA